MSDEQIEFLSLETAVEIVGAIQEEEHVHEPNRRIFTVYDKANRELCWFDYEETIADAAPDSKTLKKDEIQPKIETYILSHIPAWVAPE